MEKYYYNRKRGYYRMGQPVTLYAADGSLFSGIAPSEELLRHNGYEPAEPPVAEEGDETGEYIEPVDEPLESDGEEEPLGGVESSAENPVRAEGRSL